jgi:hypothetical protein
VGGASELEWVGSGTLAFKRGILKKKKNMLVCVCARHQYKTFKYMYVCRDAHWP